ncbi:MAG TPA: hypothetical protein VNT99_04700 [Methylomirabilota bacterium]|nr:hypothetical protein [Methylomirabilota bacterium]
MRASIAAAQISGPRVEDGGVAMLEFRFGKDDPAFAGHFPMRPVLPGIFQIEMARVVAEQVLNCSLAMREISKAKFLRPVLPDEIVQLVLKFLEQDNTILVRAGFSVGGRPAGETLLVLWRNG